MKIIIQGNIIDLAYIYRISSLIKDEIMGDARFYIYFLNQKEPLIITQMGASISDYILLTYPNAPSHDPIKAAELKKKIQKSLANIEKVYNQLIQLWNKTDIGMLKLEVEEVFPRTNTDD